MDAYNSLGFGNLPPRAKGPTQAHTELDTYPVYEIPAETAAATSGASDPPLTEESSMSAEGMALLDTPAAPASVPLPGITEPWISAQDAAESKRLVLALRPYSQAHPKALGRDIFGALPRVMPNSTGPAISAMTGNSRSRPRMGAPLRKGDTVAQFMLIGRDGPQDLMVGSGKYTAFTIQQARFAESERVRAMMSQQEDLVIETTGRNVAMLDISGVLLNTEDYEWYRYWRQIYRSRLRASQLVRSGAYLELLLDGIIYRGYITGFSDVMTARQGNAAAWNMNFLVADQSVPVVELTTLGEQEAAYYLESDFKLMRLDAPFRWGKYDTTINLPNIFAAKTDAERAKGFWEKFAAGALDYMSDPSRLMSTAKAIWTGDTQKLKDVGIGMLKSGAFAGAAGGTAMQKFAVNALVANNFPERAAALIVQGEWASLGGVSFNNVFGSAAQENETAGAAQPYVDAGALTFFSWNTKDTQTPGFEV